MVFLIKSVPITILPYQICECLFVPLSVNLCHQCENCLFAESPDFQKTHTQEGLQTLRNSTRPPILWPEKRTRIRARNFVGILTFLKVQRAIARVRARLARIAPRSSAQPLIVDIRCSLVSDFPARHPRAALFCFP